MKTKMCFSMLMFGFGLTSANALNDLRITVQSTNVILTWPSVGFEVFVVRYRTNFQLGSAWVTLSNNYPATPGTNRTMFVHYGAASFQSCSGGGSDGSGGPPPPPSSLRVSGIEGPIQATTEPGAYFEGAKRLSVSALPTNRVTLWPPLPPPLWPTLPPEERKRQEEMAAAAKALAGEASLDSEPCGTSTGFYEVLLVPDFWFDYSQYQFYRGTDFLPVYLGVEPAMVVKAELLVDGQPFPHVQYALENFNFGTPSNPDIRPTYGLWVSHDRLTNGAHYFQFRTTIQMDSRLTQDTPYLTTLAPPAPTTISNPILFGRWQNLIVGNSHTFQAQSTNYPANWEVEIYDYWGEPVRSQTGYTADGNIVWTWDLRDDWGNPRTSLENDPYFDPYLTVTPTAPPPGGPEPPPGPITRYAPLTALDYPDLGGWLIGYLEKDQWNLDAQEAIFAAMMAIRGAPSFYELPNTIVLLKYGTNLNPSGLEAQKQRNASWDDLRYRMLQRIYRNFYYQGHGTEFNIGGDFDKWTNGRPAGAALNSIIYPDGTNRVLTRAFIESGWAYQLSPIYSDAPQPYRFVFLDSCSTATGDWPYPFGIGATTNNLVHCLINS